MELNGLFPIIRRWLAVILGATAMSTVVGFLLGSAAAKTYEARAELLVGPLSTDSDTMRASGDLAQTYAQLATTDSVLATVSRDLDLPGSELQSGVRATANSTTRFLVIRARSHDGKDAADIANAVSLQLLALGKQDPTRPEGQLRVIDPARVSSDPVSPRLDLIVPLAAVAGLLGSLTLVLLFEFVGDTAESVEKVEAATGVPTLAVKRKRGRAGGDGPGGLDPHRIIATQAELAAPGVRCVLVTGVADKDGTPDLARRLAQVWSQRRQRVTLIDATTGEVTGLTRAGVTVRRRQPAGLFGEAEAVTVALAAEVLEEVETGDGIVIIHAPPATVSAATLVWARVADVTILGVRRFQARRSMIEDVAVNLRAVDANLAFSVLHERYRPSEVRAAAPIDAPLDPEPAAAPTTGARRASLETVATDGTSGGGAGESTSPRRRTRPAPSTSGTRR